MPVKNHSLPLSLNSSKYPVHAQNDQVYTHNPNAKQSNLAHLLPRTPSVYYSASIASELAPQMYHHSSPETCGRS